MTRKLTSKDFGAQRTVAVHMANAQLRETNEKLIAELHIAQQNILGLEAEIDELDAGGMEQAKRIHELSQCLMALVREVGGAWRAFEHWLRGDIGNTNYNIIADLITQGQTILHDERLAEAGETSSALRLIKMPE